MSYAHQISMSFSRHWCARHVAGLAGDTASQGRAMLGLFIAAALEPDIVRGCGGFIGADGEIFGAPDADRLPAVVEAFAPICCKVGDAAAEMIVAEALQGRVWGLNRITRGFAITVEATDPPIFRSWITRRWWQRRRGR